jgi:hypothetical protein
MLQIFIFETFFFCSQNVEPIKSQGNKLEAWRSCEPFTLYPTNLMYREFEESYYLECDIMQSAEILAKLCQTARPS